MADTSNWLEALKTIQDIDILVKSMGLTSETIVDFWKDLLAVLHSEQTPLNHMTEDSLMDFITKYTDLADIDTTGSIYISQLYSEILDLIRNDNDTYWNESVHELIKFIIENMIQDNDSIILPIGPNGEHSITIRILKESDAGNNFPIIPDDDNTIWVKPWWNINDKNYDQVRKHDPLLEVLQNDSKMQYTHSKRSVDKEEQEEYPIYQWLRLLMPQYGRRVQVEDLDRNFWVIAQTIAAISNYLLGQDSPIPKIIEGLTREVSEIWENIPYLWTNIAIINQKSNSKIITIHMPVPHSSNNHGKIYDNCDETNIEYYVDANEEVVITPYTNIFGSIAARINYLKHEYSGYNLCVLPYLRLHNYKQNYYATQYYPAIYFYEQNGNEDENSGWRYYKLNDYASAAVGQDGPVGFSLEGEMSGLKFNDLIYGTRQDNNNIKWGYPFSKINEMGSSESVVCYGCLRAMPNIQCEWDERTQKIKLTSMEIGIYDAAAELITGKAQQVGLWRFVRLTVKPDMTYCNMSGSYTSFEQPAQTPDLQVKAYDIDKMGYYLGEVASWRSKTAEVTESEELFTSNSYVIKLGNFLPKSGSFTMASYTYNSTYYYTSMYGNVTKTVQNFANADTYYYKFDWYHYKPSLDKQNDQSTMPQGNSNICFRYTDGSGTHTAIEEKPCTYPTKDNLTVDGLKAAKAFILNSITDTSSPNDRTKSPCFIITTVGLTPWRGSGRTGNDIYWDVALVHAIYMYIPSAYTLSGGHATDTDTIKVSNYNAAFQNAPTFNAGGESGEIYHNGNLIGKISSCHIMNRYEAYQYYEGIKLCGDVYTVVNGGRWRQFYVVNDSSANSCTMTLINGGASVEGGITKYNAKFDSEGKFVGIINYFDVNCYNSITNPGPLDKCSNAQVSTAKITVDSTGYHQDTTVDGKIASAKDVTTPFDTRANVALNKHCTGFPQKMITNSQGNYVEQAENIFQMIERCANQDARYFHGITPLYRDNNWNGYFCKYKT